MKTYLDCFPCFVEQAVRAARLVTDDEVVIKKILDEVGSHFKDVPLTNTPPETGEFIYRRIREITGVNDPYKDLKRASIAQVLSVYPRLLEMVHESDDPLLTSIRLSTIGNVLDFGISMEYNLMEEVEMISQMRYAIFHYAEFREQLEGASSVLFIGDNAGESVFDRLLIGELGKPVTYVVREAPVINDATMEDAMESGLHEVAEIISSGSTAPGTILGLCNKDFLERFAKAGLVISKGQGNYEGLSGAGRTIFFLLRAKCPVIAQNLKVQLNDFIFKGINL
ncbi:MAG: ARMT1-like domain-containing protein [Bacteroidales bacterium]